MNFINGKVVVNKNDFKKLEEKGYTISRHAEHYTNYIGIEAHGLSAWFCNWNDNLKFWIEAGEDYQLELKINTKEDFESAINLIDALTRVRGLIAF